MADWTDATLSFEWAKGDNLESLLALPRRITADVLALRSRPVATVVDVGSGPGGFLAVLLERLPSSRGVWTDVSPAMRTLAGGRLGPFVDRVEYRLLPAGELSQLANSGKVDAVVTSRMTHHLTFDELVSFYRDAACLLGEDGVIANIDHVTMPAPWGPWLRAARGAAIPGNPSPVRRHDHPQPTLGHHLRALDAVGGLETVVAWQAYTTVLILAGRRGEWSTAPAGQDRPGQKR